MNLNSATHLDGIYPSQVKHEPSDINTEDCMQWDENLSPGPEGEYLKESEEYSRSADGDLVDEGNWRLESVTGTKQRNEPTASERPLKRDIPSPASPPPIKKYRVQNCTPAASPLDLRIRRVSPDEKLIRIVLSDEHGLREYNVVTPEGKYGKFKVTLKYSGAGPSSMVQLSSDFTPASSAKAVSMSSNRGQVEKEIMTEPRNEGSQLKRNPSGSPPSKKLQCSVQNCLKSFKSRGALRNHYRSVHLALKYKCNLCPNTYRLSTNIYRHLRTAHKEKLAMARELKSLFNECHD